MQRDGFSSLRNAMKFMTRVMTAASLALVIWSGVSNAQNATDEDCPPVTAPPESFFELVSPRDRDEARRFYQKYLDVQGMPVVAAAEVADQALERTYSIVTHLLAGRSDIIDAMVKNRMYLIVIG